MKRQPLILCIDSNADACEILEILMNRAGFQVVSKHRAEDGLQAVRETPFSIIISEYLLTDKNGLDLLPEIKKFDPEVPVVFYSTEARNEHKERGLSAGAKAFLVKPNDLGNIEKTVLDLALI